MSDRYINIDRWAALPDVILEQIFAYLPLRYLGRCSQVCINWNRIFVASTYAWQLFVYEDFIFTRRKFTQHAGWLYVLDHWRIRYLITNTARKWRHLIIRPVTLLFNLYEFIRVLTNFSEYYENTGDQRPLADVQTFEFNWQLHIHDYNTVALVKRKENHDETTTSTTTKVYGTGGEILKSLSMLLSHLHGLRHLSLRQLQLDSWECQPFIDEVLEKFGEMLYSLTIINLTKYRHPLMQIGVFLNLHTLCVSAQHLDDDVIVLISSLQSLAELSIIQDEKTIGAVVVSARAWEIFKRSNDYTHVHLIITGRCRTDLLLQPNAPVYSIVFDRSIGQLTEELADRIVDNYSQCLHRFVQRNRERRYRSRRFINRCDRPLLRIAIGCVKLRMLAIRERIATATMLLVAIAIARQCENDVDDRRWLCVRENAIIRQIGWTKNDVDMMMVNVDGKCINFDWLKSMASDYTKTIDEMRKILPTFRPMTDNEYMRRVF